MEIGIMELLASGLLVFSAIYSLMLLHRARLINDRLDDLEASLLQMKTQLERDEKLLARETAAMRKAEPAKYPNLDGTLGKELYGLKDTAPAPAQSNLHFLAVA